VNSWKQTLVAAAIMGLVAAACVWWLQTDSRNRLADQFQKYLEKVDRFNVEFPEGNE
jgi:type II secretory pathway pseudopilin PulG